MELRLTVEKAYMPWRVAPKNKDSMEEDMKKQIYAIISKEIPIPVMLVSLVPSEKEGIRA